MRRPSTWKTSHLSPGRAGRVRAPWRRFWRLSILSHYLCTESLPGSQTLRLRSKSWPGLCFCTLGLFAPGQAAQAARGGRRGAGKCRSVSFPVCTVSCGQPRQPAPRISWLEPDTQLFTRDTLHTEANNVFAAILILVYGKKFNLHVCIQQTEKVV